MIAFAFGAATFGLVHGWITDNPAELILGFFCLLIGFALVLARDSRQNHAVIYDLNYARHRRVSGRQDAA